MTTEAALLEAIYERPDDDAARWVYTDYLLEHGDPRGEFMVLQLLRKRRKLTPDEQRAERLLLRHATDWVPREVAKKTLRATWRFERGFLARCQLRPSDQPVGSPQHGHPAWRTVHTLQSDGQAFGPNRVLFAPALDELRHLAIGGQGFLESFLRDRRPMPELETFGFSWYMPDDRVAVTQLCASSVMPNLLHLVLMVRSVVALTELAASDLAARIERLSLWDRNAWEEVPAELRARVRAVDFDAYGVLRRRFEAI